MSIGYVIGKSAKKVKIFTAVSWNLSKVSMVKAKAFTVSSRAEALRAIASNIKDIKAGYKA